MLLLTYATHNTGYFDTLILSAERNDFEIKVIGWGEKWKGFSYRLLQLANYCESIDSNEIVMIVDAFDCIILGTPDETIDKFNNLVRKYGNKVFFSASKNHIMLDIFFGKTNKKFENYDNKRLVAGCYIGYASNIVRLFKILCEQVNCNEKKLDDQKELNKLICNNCMDLDNECSLFYNIEWEKSNFQGFLDIFWQKDEAVPINNKYYEFIDNRLYIKKLGSKPVVLHGNGNLNLDNICNFLELSIKKKDKRDYYNYSTGLFVEYFTNKLFLYIFIFIIIVSIIYIIIYIFTSRLNYYIKK